MKIASGTTDQYIYFVAVDSTDYVTREPTLSSFTVYRSRDGGVAAAMTTPTINETDVTNMPGVYELLLDEDMTIGSGNDTEEMVFHITHAGMAPVSRAIELYRSKITAGNTLDVTATGAAGIDWANVENPTTALDLSGTDIQLVDTTTTNTDMRGTDSAALASALTTHDGKLDTVDTNVNTINTNVSALNDISAANVNAEVLDVLNTDTFAEPASVPAATASLVDKIGWLMALARNKLTQTATTATLRNDADGADIATSTVADDGTTATRGEWT